MKWSSFLNIIESRLILTWYSYQRMRFHEARMRVRSVCCGLNWVFSAHFMIICKAFYEMLGFVLRLVVTVLSQWMSYWDIPLRYTLSKYQYPLICRTVFVHEKWALGYRTQTINNFCTEMCSLQTSKLLLAIINVFSGTSNVCQRNFKRYFNKQQGDTRSRDCCSFNGILIYDDF